MTSTTSTTTTGPVTTVTTASERTLTIGRTGISCDNLNFGGRCISCLNGLPVEVIQLIALRCISGTDYSDLRTFSLVNRSCNICARTLMDAIDAKVLMELCPGLTILDAKAQRFNVDDEPRINKNDLFESFRKLAPQVENDAGLTLLTVPKGLSPFDLMTLARDAGIEIKGTISSLRNVDCVTKTYRIMITNAPVKGTHCCSTFWQGEDRVEGGSHQEYLLKWAGFDLPPSLEEHLLLIISTQKVSNLNICLFGQGTYGCSSTWGGFHCIFDQERLHVGNTAPGLIYVDTNKNNESRGAAGVRRMSEEDRPTCCELVCLVLDRVESRILNSGLIQSYVDLGDILGLVDNDPIDDEEGKLVCDTQVDMGTTEKIREVLWCILRNCGLDAV